MTPNEPPRPSFTPGQQQDPRYGSSRGRPQGPYQDPYPPQQTWPGQSYGQPPPYGQPPGYAPPGRPGRGAPKRRHPVRGALIIAAGVFLVVIIISAAVSGGKQPAPAAAGPATSAAAASPAAAKSTSAAVPTITYVVTGSTSADITYGPEGSNLAGHIPMRVTKKLGHAEYYAIQAQLNGDGEVAVKILVDGKVISSGHDSGAYNIASAEIDQDPFTGKWENVQ